MKPNLTRGVATVPIILVFGILIVAIGIGIAALSFSESLASQGGYQSTRALLYAEAGARDALERIARNKNYSCTSADCYELDLASGGCAGNSACARMSVSGGVGSEADPKVITATGRAGINLRTLEVSVTLDNEQFGRIASTTWKEITN